MQTNVTKVKDVSESVENYEDNEFDEISDEEMGLNVILSGFYCGLSVFTEILSGFLVSNRPQCPPRYTEI